MGRLNNIINILLVIQACSALPYGHPDAETIEIGSNLSSSARDQFVINAAVGRGMDGEAVAELLRTKQPVVKVKVDPSGSTTTTTTYTLGADGSIATRTLTETKPVRTYHIGSVSPDSVSLDDLFNSPSGTVSRTYVDKDGSKVTQTVSMGKPRTTSVLPDQDEFNWFGAANAPGWGNSEFPMQVHRNNPVPQAGGGQTNYHKTVTTYSGPNGQKSVTENWSSAPESHEPGHKTPAFNWPSFNSAGVSQTWPSVGDVGGDDDGWTVVAGQPDVEATTIKKHPSWTPKIEETIPNQRPFQPQASTPLPSLEDFLDKHFKATPPKSPQTSNKKPVVTQVEEAQTLPSLEDFLDTKFIATLPASSQSSHPAQVPTQPKVSKTLPSLDEFLDSQFAAVTPSTAIPSSLQPKVTTPLPSLEDFLESQYTPHTSPSNSNGHNKPVTIQIEDLPVTRILYNGKPADENIVNRLPAHLQPKPQAVYENEWEPSVRKVIKPHTSSDSEPNLANLDPQLLELLRNAGISIDDITNIDGDTVTKTRTEPDGSIVTTTFKVRTTPTTVTSYEPAPPPKVYTTSSHSHSSKNMPATPAGAPSKLSPVKEYLAKVGLTESDILAENGEYTRTFIDEDGQVLTATFVLSRPLGESDKLQNTKIQKPLK